MDSFETWRTGFLLGSCWEKHGCSRPTLTQRHKGQAGLMQEKVENQRVLHPRDKAEHVEYIRGLSEGHIPPTMQTIVDFACPLAI